MMKNEKRVTRFIGIWAEKKEQSWLKEMSRSGWHLYKVGFLTYWFKKGEPKDMIYQFDFPEIGMKDTAEYLETYREDGWDYIGTMGNWYYFSKAEDAPGSKNIYTDKDTLLKKYKRVLMFLTILGFPLLYNNMILFQYRGTGSPYAGVFSLVVAVVFGLYLYAYIRIFLYLRSLKLE